MNLIDRVNWTIAEARADPRRLFVLWAVAVRFCTRIEDFQEHYGSDLQIESLIDKLTSDGLLDTFEGLLRLTILGEAAIADLDDKYPMRTSGERQPTSREALRVGIVGLGYWGTNLIRNFYALPNCRITAICDVSEFRLKLVQTLYPDLLGLTDFDEFLKSGPPDAVVIAAPLKHHYSLAKASLQAGKHILIEPPMATSSAECEELIELAEQNGLVLMVGHTSLYSASVRKIVEVIEAGDIGEIRYIHSRRLNLGFFAKEFNVAWDLAYHDIAIILHILKEQPLVVNCLGNAHVNRDIEDVTIISLTFHGKQLATIHSSWIVPKKTREMTIVGARRTIEYDDMQVNEAIRIFDARVEIPPYHDTFTDFHYSYHYGDMYSPHVKQEEPLRVECGHFLECIKDLRSPLTDGNFGLNVVRILAAASSSLRSFGSPISLTHSERSVTDAGSAAATRFSGLSERL